MTVSENCAVISNKSVSIDGNLITFSSEKIAHSALPGQFVEVSCSDGGMLLRRPFSVYDTTAESLSLFVKSVGRGTRWLGGLREGEKVNIIGPLGKGFSIDEGSRSLLIGGGCGVASLRLLSKAIVEAGGECDAIFGFRKREEIPETIVGDFSRTARRLTVTVDSGDYPVRGNVMDRLAEIEFDRYGRYYCCGPTAMLRALVPLLSFKATEVSLEAKMACGLGVCYGCTINTDRGGKRVCYDGPVFTMKEVEWNDL